MTMPEFETYDDGAFNVFSTRWGTYASKTADGKGLFCGLDKESVIFWSREYFNGYANSYVTYPKKASDYQL
jgi:hypothetical protein